MDVLKSMTERKKLVLAMELIARCINDEEVFAHWLACGVADEDIPRFSVDVADVDDSYIEDSSLAQLMTCFLGRMNAAYACGGLTIDGVTSDTKKEREGYDASR